MEEQCNEFEQIDTITTIHVEGLSCIEINKESSQLNSVGEELLHLSDSTQVVPRFKPMTLCATLGSEVRTGILSQNITVNTIGKGSSKYI